MTILVISDSHRSVEPVHGLLRLYAPSVGIAVHLGDNADDLLRFQREFPSVVMHAVKGNCDHGPSGEPEKIISVNGRRLLLTHGHRFNVKLSADRLAYYAQEKEANACLFGHTHQPAVFDLGGVLFMNPGSVSQPRLHSQAGYGLLSVSEQGILKAVTMPMGVLP